MTIEEILQKEESTYYPLLKSTIEISPNYPLSKDEEDRLNDELEIIHKMKQSKVVWYC